MGNKHQKYDLAQMQTLPLSTKIRMSKQRIKQWYEHYDGEVYVSFSGGKDSTVLLDLVRSEYPDVEAVYIDTGLEYPEVKKHIYTYDNVTILRPKMNFKQVIEKYGYPVISKEVSCQIYEARNTNSEYLRNKRLHGIQRDGSISNSGMIPKKWQYLVHTDIPISDKCCRVMKKQPIHAYEKKSGKVAFVGTLADESTLRRQSWLKHGCNAFDMEHPQSRPLSFWTEQDVLHYITLHQLEIPSVYGEIVESDGKLKTTGCDRTGCVYCAYGCHLESKENNRFLRLKETHPKLYDYSMNVLGFDKVLTELKILH